MKLKDNVIYRSIMIPICVALCFFSRYIPAPQGLTQDAMGVIGIFVGTIVIIVLSDDKNSAVRSNFDAAHELGHILLHDWNLDLEELFAI